MLKTVVLIIIFEEIVIY